MKAIDKIHNRPTWSVGVPPASRIPAHTGVLVVLFTGPDIDHPEVENSRLYVKNGSKTHLIDHSGYAGWINPGEFGAALITSLIFLTFLTILGMSTLGTAMLESRMAGNSRDRNLAFQAAEMGLRDAERYIRDSGRIVGVNEEGYDTDDCAPASNNCDAQLCRYGLCYNGGNMAANGSGNAWYKSGFAVWESETKWNNALQYAHTADADGIAGGTKRYGYTSGGVLSFNINCGQVAGNCQYSQPDELPLVRRQPEYLIEAFEKSTGGQRYYYRITVRGYGMRTGTRVMLQEVYTP